MSACERALDYAKSKGIDECDCVSVSRKITTVRITDSEIAEIKQNQETSFCVRLIHQKRISSAQSSIQGDEVRTVSKALELSQYSKPKDFWKNLPNKLQEKSELSKTLDKKIQEITTKKAVDVSQEMINSALRPKISSITGSVNFVYEDFMLANSNGLQAHEKATYTSAIINADSEFGSSPVSGLGQNCCRMLYSLKPERIGTDAAEMCLDSINPQKCDEGFYTMIFEPYAIGEILAFVLASNFNFRTFSEKRSCFSDDYQKKIAVNDLSIIDDPHFPDAPGSKTFDDEGIPTNPQALIQNGIFANTFSNLFDAYKENSKSTGNAVRPGSPMGRNAESIPMASPHNLVIKKGTTNQEELIKETKNGLLIGRLWYTYAVNPTKGDFSCTARSGIRIIKNGQIVSPGKSVRIIHNLKLLLKNISGIADNSKNILPWASITAITPSVKAEKIKAIPI